MQIKKMLRLSIALCLAVTVSLPGCGLYDLPDEIDDPSPSIEDFAVEPKQTQTNKRGDEIFSLVYDTGASLNPLTCADSSNTVLMGLMFEGLFYIDEEFTAQPLLCRSWTSLDGLNFIFEIRNGIIFHDGTDMTADDVVYSVNHARTIGPYVNRLSCVSDVFSENGLVKIVLSKPNMQFPALLDIPVMKSGTGDDTIPVGTGPYTYTEAADYRFLSAFTQYRDYTKLPIQRFYLKEYETEDLIQAFEKSYIDLVVTNTSEPGFVQFSEEFEKRLAATTEMHFLGFNNKQGYCASALRRLILSSLIDRDSLTTTLLPDTVPVVLPVNPLSPLYLMEVADTALIKPESINDFMISAFVEDFDHDEELEYISNNQVTDFALDMIVNRENNKKVSAARQIAETWKSKGYNIILHEMSWDAYQTALNAGQYDIFYGEVKLTCDFDLSELLGTSGTANFGVSDSELDSLIYAFNSSGKETRLEATKDLFVYLCDNVYIAPLLFEKLAVFTHRGVVSNMIPTQQNIYHRIKDWHIEF
ncbi:MAG: ABC transporter substrate-binding protein [Clostridiales bacterium]|nr:ABC transporter substrate-binding protein [Clostridiales bacterium]